VKEKIVKEEWLMGNSVKQNLKMQDLVEFLDNLLQKEFNLKYTPLQTPEQYKKFDMPLRTQRSLQELQSFLTLQPTPEGIAYNVVILSLAEKNFVPELVRNRMPEANPADTAVKDLILAIKSNLYGLFRQTLDKLTDAKNEKEIRTVLENYLNERVNTVEQAFNMPSKYIAQFKSGQIQLRTAVAFANSIAEHFNMNFRYMPIASQNMLYYRLPYQPNYKVKELSDNILMSLHSNNKADSIKARADSYEYILELANTEENIVGLRNQPTLNTARKNIASAIVALRMAYVDPDKLINHIESLFNSYFKEREVLAIKMYGMSKAER